MPTAENLVNRIADADKGDERYSQSSIIARALVSQGVSQADASVFVRAKGCPVERLVNAYGYGSARVAIDLAIEAVDREISQETIRATGARPRI
ncbi:MAG: hypothetical protein ING19_17550 [Azospirillum sp.]|nr:hypothetical protein [Azospirillum sp.]